MNSLSGAFESNIELKTKKSTNSLLRRKSNHLEFPNNSFGNFSAKNTLRSSPERLKSKMSQPFRKLSLQPLNNVNSTKNKEKTISKELANEPDEFQNLINRAQEELHTKINIDNCEKELKVSENDLRNELIKWKTFGQYIAQSYDELKEKFEKEVASGLKNKFIIRSLKDKLSKLTDTLETLESENGSLRKELSIEEKEREKLHSIELKLNNTIEENTTLKRENERLVKLTNYKEKKYSFNIHKTQDNSLPRTLPCTRM